MAIIIYKKYSGNTYVCRRYNGNMCKYTAVICRKTAVLCRKYNFTPGWLMIFSFERIMFISNWFIIYFTCFTIPLWTAVCDVLMLFWLVDCHVEKGSLLCHVDKYLKLKTNFEVCPRQHKYKKTIPWIVQMTYPLGRLVKMKTRETSFSPVLVMWRDQIH